MVPIRRGDAAPPYPCSARRLTDGFKRHWFSPGNVPGAFFDARLRCSPRVCVYESWPPPHILCCCIKASASALVWKGAAMAPAGFVSLGCGVLSTIEHFCVVDGLWTTQNSSASAGVTRAASTIALANDFSIGHLFGLRPCNNLVSCRLH
jgi:hypothetical protein